MIIDPESPEHPYLQVAAMLRERILNGEIRHLLPSLTDLCNETGLAPNTVRRAIKVLRDEGLVHTVPGRGTFARPP